MARPRYRAAAEIAAMIAYLASPEAGFVTAASLTIEGGFTAERAPAPLTAPRRRGSIPLEPAAAEERRPAHRRVHEAPSQGQ